MEQNVNFLLAATVRDHSHNNNELNIDLTIIILQDHLIKYNIVSISLSETLDEVNE